MWLLLLHLTLLQPRHAIEKFACSSGSRRETRRVAAAITAGHINCSCCCCCRLAALPPACDCVCGNSSRCCPLKYLVCHDTQIEKGKGRARPKEMTMTMTPLDFCSDFVQAFFFCLSSSAKATNPQQQLLPPHYPLLPPISFTFQHGQHQ